mmetsp:Transcript_63965/g.101806  ORF Transcript_63965/g.101806 Transcript_63965/m.101806 type:complete len:295 (+) Transcript_63965:70-954(+)
MSLWMWFRTLCVAIFAALMGMNRTATRAVSDVVGSDTGVVELMTGLSNVFQQVAKGVSKHVQNLVQPETEPELSPIQQLSQYAHDMHHQTVQSRAAFSEVVSKMQMVGMKEFVVVQRMTFAKHLVREKVSRGLSSKGLPSEIAEAIGLQLDGVEQFYDKWDDFVVDGTGSAHTYRVQVALLCENETKCQIALSASGASFNAAKEIDHYETQRIPEYGERVKLVTVHEDGLFGRYETKKEVKERVQIGMRENKIPILKEKTFTPETMEAMKNYLEGKALDEFRLAAPINQKRQLA